MKKRVVLMSVALSCTILLNSCGVMFGGSKYNGTIVAKDHPNAEIYVNDQKMGVGEVSGLYKRDQPLKVTLKEEGCQPKTENFENAFRTGNFILSLISWGLVGIAIDLGTGASYKPDHRNNPSIEKLNDKDYTFSIDYSECERPE